MVNKPPFLSYWNCIIFRIFVYVFFWLLAKELGRAAYIDEVFQQTHMRKGTDQFVDERSRRTL